MAGNEARCAELGANCLCSEPLNTNSFTEVVQAYWDADDTTTKKCKYENSFISYGSGFIPENYEVVSSGVMFDALPNLDPSIVYILKNLEGYGGGFHGHTFLESDPTGRIAMRFYLYRSSAFTLTTESGGLCFNSSKIFELFNGGSTSLVHQGDGNYLFYGWGNQWNLADGYDCCFEGPGPNDGNMLINNALIRDKWFRYECAITNPLATGSVTEIRVWEKNVTDDLDEVLILDTSMPTTQSVGDPWGTTQATTLKPDFRIQSIVNVPFRNGNCAGFYGFTHYLAAAWDTDTGQRIGAATEIEGSGTPPPATQSFGWIP